MKKLIIVLLALALALSAPAAFAQSVVCGESNIGYPRWKYHEDSSSALTDTTVNASCGTGLYNYIETISFSVGGATAASIKIEDGTSTTILGPYYTEAVVGRGVWLFWPGGRKQTNSATLISVTTTGAVAHGLDITGFCAP